MEFSQHEDHSFADPNFPIIFHLDTCIPGSSVTTGVHWHENIEILYFIEGQGTIYYNAAKFHAKAGDIVIINPNVLHGIVAVADRCRYYCLIIDNSLYEHFDVPMKHMMFREVIQDATAQDYYDKIVREWTDRPIFYQAAIKLTAQEFLLYLCRCHVDYTDSTSAVHSKQIAMVKEAINYIRSHFQDEITIDQICEAIGFSKYYFCRVFKEITHRTPVGYINYIRCSYAKNLLLSGQYNVSETAELSGFKNLSYFSKTYKKYIGTLPSQKEKAE